MLSFLHCTCLHREKNDEKCAPQAVQEAVPLIVCADGSNLGPFSMVRLVACCFCMSLLSGPVPEKTAPHSKQVTSLDRGSV